MDNPIEFRVTLCSEHEWLVSRDSQPRATTRSLLRAIEMANDMAEREAMTCQRTTKVVLDTEHILPDLPASA